MPTVPSLRKLSLWSSMGLWGIAFLSPTASLFGFVVLAKQEAPAPPFWLIVALFFLMPLVALWFCSSIAWKSHFSRHWRTVWLVFTVVGMLLQFGALVVLIFSLIAVAISLPQ